ncbi:MAG: tripartite tricarboxylate transporter permease [Fusobacteriaceae bacterium]|jgi:putative tricarboxylic transport membrane protein|nr:tripartite tricarboxylate transporter permease [Fusobacteriaceae bacterium]
MNWSLLFGSYGNVVLNPQVMGMIFLGAVGGVLIGSIPGLTATMGIALLIPFTYGMDLIPSIGLLLGIFCGGMYGGSISAILIHTPGTPAAAATVMDGYPMGQKGEAGRALSIALYSSFVGGMIGAVLMTFLSPLISKMALKFGPGEFFTLAVFGLSVIISISGKSIVKGLISAFFGLLLATVGMDKVCAYLRFTRAPGLYDGMPFIPTLIGLFALSEVFAGVEKITVAEKIKATITRVLPTMADVKTIMVPILRGGLIGTFIGAIPGAGGDIAAFVSYGETKRASKHPEYFGTGVPEGIAAAESANNGCSGGAMIPLLSLGVPGDSNTAVMLGAFIMKGIQPGPMMYVEHLDLVYSIFAAMITANIAMLIVGGCGVKLFAKVISIDKKKLLPVILVLSLVGAYSINGNLFDAGLAIVMGLVGYLLQKYEFPLSPILLALILGPMSESNLRRFMQIHDSKFWLLFTRPICVVLIILAVASLVSSVLNQKKIEKRTAGEN